MQPAINRNISISQEWLRGESPQWEIDQACIGESGAVASRAMTAEERRHYGGPAMVVCPSCRRLLPQTRKHFAASIDGFGPYCRDCVAGHKIKKPARRAAQ